MSELNLENVEEIYRRELLRPQTLKAGKESEYILVSTSEKRFGECVLPAEVQQLFQLLAEELSGTPSYDDMTNKITSLRADIPYPGKPEHLDAVDIMTDFGVGTLEIAFPPQESVAIIARQTDQLLSKIVEIADDLQIAMLGYGIQPLSPPDKSLVAPKGRYRTLESRFSTQKHLDGKNTDVHFHTINAAEQIHVGVPREKDGIAGVNFLNAMNTLSPLLNALFANSRVWKGMIDPEYIEPREVFWDWVVNIPQDKTRKGILPRMRSIEDYVQCLLNHEPVLTFRNEDGVMRSCEFIGVSTFRDYLTAGEANVIAPGTKSNPKPMRLQDGRMLDRVSPTLFDLFVHESFAWYQARFKAKYGTVEVRCTGQQHPDERFSVLALVYGLRLNDMNLHDYVAKHVAGLDVSHHRRGFLREGLAYGGLGEYTREILHTLCDLAKEGLLKQGEDTALLDPLYQRIATRQSLSDRAVDVFTRQGMRGLVETFRYRQLHVS